MVREDDRHLTTMIKECPMRRITAGLFISLDGVVEDPQDWHFPYFNDEMGEAVVAHLGAADTVLLVSIHVAGRGVDRMSDLIMDV
jgi:hypothetical protein